MNTTCFAGFIKQDGTILSCTLHGDLFGNVSAAIESDNLVRYRDCGDGQLALEYVRLSADQLTTILRLVHDGNILMIYRDRHGAGADTLLLPDDWEKLS